MSSYHLRLIEGPWMDVLKIFPVLDFDDFAQRLVLHIFVKTPTQRGFSAFGGR